MQVLYKGIRIHLVSITCIIILFQIIPNINVYGFLMFILLIGRGNSNFLDHWFDNRQVRTLKHRKELFVTDCDNI